MDTKREIVDEKCECGHLMSEHGPQPIMGWRSTMASVVGMASVKSANVLNLLG